MDRPNKRKDEITSQLRERFLSVLKEPIPPNLVALVERLREHERVKKRASDADAEATK